MLSGAGVTEYPAPVRAHQGQAFACEQTRYFAGAACGGICCGVFSIVNGSPAGFMST